MTRTLLVCLLLTACGPAVTPSACPEAMNDRTASNVDWIVNIPFHGECKYGGVLSRPECNLGHLMALQTSVDDLRQWTKTATMSDCARAGYQTWVDYAQRNLDEDIALASVPVPPDFAPHEPITSSGILFISSPPKLPVTTSLVQKYGRRTVPFRSCHLQRGGHTVETVRNVDQVVCEGAR